MSRTSVLIAYLSSEMRLENIATIYNMNTSRLSPRYEPLGFEAIIMSNTVLKRSLTLFTSPSCSLCQIAQGSLNKVKERLRTENKDIEWETINIKAPENQAWFVKYQFDV